MARKGLTAAGPFLLSLRESSGTLEKLAGSSLEMKGIKRSRVFTQHKVKLESLLLGDVVL